MLQVLNNTELQALDEEQEQVDQAVRDVDSQPSPALPSLAAYIRNCFDRAKNAHDGIEQQILKNMRQKQGVYEPDKLAAIKAMKSSEIFMMITDVKCRHAKDWIEDVIFQPGTRPFNIEPTPLPEVPQFIEDRIYQMSVQNLMNEMMMQSAAAGMPVPMEALPGMIDARMPEVLERVKKELVEEAKRIAENMEEKIEDQLIEGGFYKALHEFIPDMVMHTGFISGPCYIKEKHKVLIPDPLTGRMAPTVRDQIIPKFRRVKPLDIYPSPDSNGINDGYLVEKSTITGTDLSQLIGVPTFSEPEIRSVLQEYGTGGLREWTGIDTERASLEHKDASVAHDSDKIDMLIFNGAIQGRMLLEWGIEAMEIPDPDIFYPAVAYLVGTHVIKAVLNDDPMGLKPYSKGSFDETDGGFWGRGLPQVISDVQDACNAAARHMLNNIGFAAGPMVEINDDRAPGALDAAPMRTWRVTQDQMGSPAPALRFYTPPFIADKLMAVYEKWSQLADEHSGVPAYSHGDPNVGGAGNTASGLSMLMTSASRGIKGLIRTIDQNIIEPCVTRQYYDNIRQVENAALVGDFKVVAKGSSSLIAKEQQAIRRGEFLRDTANQFDMPIIGLEGRKYMLKERARALEMDADKAVPDGPPPTPPGAGLVPPPPNPANPGIPPGQTLGPSGEPAGGTDFKLFNGGAIPNG